MLSRVWDEITHPFRNFNGATVEVQELIGNFVPRILMDEILIHTKTKVNPC